MDEFADKAGDHEHGHQDGGAVPLPGRGASPSELLWRRQQFPYVDADALRADIDAALDSAV